MEILTTKDFNQIPYNVPNTEAQNPDGTLQENVQFANYIATKTQDILIKLLGPSLYESFIGGLDALPPEWKDDVTYPADAQIFYNYHVWKSLVDNNTNHPPKEDINWTMVPDNEWLMLYNGVKSYSYNIKDFTWKGMKEMLIPYVYALWLRDTHDDHTKVGVVLRTAENATVISPAKRIARAYNQFSMIAGNYYYRYNTLYGYLLYAQSLGHFDGAYDADFSTFYHYLACSFKDPGRMNIFNI